MKKGISIIGLLVLSLLIQSAGLAQVISSSLTAEPRENYIVLRWSTNDESGIEKFQILRKEVSQGEYMIVSDVAKKGNNSNYIYEDRTVFKTSGRVFQYMVRAYNPSNIIAEEKTTIVSYGLSSAARRTWGSIKSMFR